MTIDYLTIEQWGQRFAELNKNYRENPTLENKRLLREAEKELIAEVTAMGGGKVETRQK